MLVVININILLECTRTVANDPDCFSLKCHWILFSTNSEESGWVIEMWTYRFGTDCRSTLFRIVSETDTRCSRV